MYTQEPLDKPPVTYSLDYWTLICGLSVDITLPAETPDSRGDWSAESRVRVRHKKGAKRAATYHTDRPCVVKCYILTQSPL